jgi:diguanylate cyclase
MRTDSLIALKIGQDPPQSLGLVLRPLLERAAAAMGTAVQSLEGEGPRAELTGQLEGFRAAVEAASDDAHITAATHACFELCEQLLHTMQTQQDERRGELRRLVALVRDTVQLLVGDGDAFSSDISQAATRFNALLRINDVQQLKQRLTAEVGDLQRLATARQQQWRQTVEMFEARIVSLEKQLVAVQHEASLDAVTGIANRRHFEQALREALQSTPREFIVAVLDIDDFKTVNDTGGHAAGDAVLQAVAQALKSSVRKHDLVARLGGDEFAVLGRMVSLRDAEPRVKSIVANVATIPTNLEHPARVSVSCGLAEYCAGDTLESLLRRADQALYEAKRHGKNRVVVKSPPFIRDLLQKKH